MLHTCWHCDFAEINNITIWLTYLVMKGKVLTKGYTLRLLQIMGKCHLPSGWNLKCFFFLLSLFCRMDVCVESASLSSLIAWSSANRMAVTGERLLCDGICLGNCLRFGARWKRDCWLSDSVQHAVSMLRLTDEGCFGLWLFLGCVWSRPTLYHVSCWATFKSKICRFFSQLVLKEIISIQTLART